MSQFENLKLENQLCFALYSTSNTVTRLFRQLLTPYNLTYPQYLVLIVLWEEDGVAIKEVMQKLHLDSGTLSPIIKRLQTAGLIDKIRQDQDERIVRLFLTDKAKKLEPLVADVQNQIACHTRLTTEQFHHLLSQLNQLNETLSATDIAPLEQAS